MTLKAPWTDAQVKALNEYQRNQNYHPFTCGSGNRMDGPHRRVQAHRGGDFGELVATPEGWICPACDYTQDWAHDFMVNTPSAAEISSKEEAGD